MSTPSLYPTPEYLVLDSGDYDGDGITDVSIFRSSNGLWAIKGLTRIYFGSNGDSPVTGNFAGDMLDEFGIFRPSAGLWAVRGISRVYFGSNGDIPVTR